MAEESLLDSEAMHRFADIELGDDRVPDETTILNFRHLLEKHDPAEKVFAEADAYLADKGVELRGGTLVDATTADAPPSSTKNKARARDPEMSSTKKGGQWHFGTEAHVGVDADSGIARSLDTTTAKTHDSQVRDGLLHGRERTVFADKAYADSDREAASEKNGGSFWGVMRKAPKGGELDSVDKFVNEIIASVKARIEHPFRVTERQFGHAKTRYRGLAKNRAHLSALFALGNLFPARRRLMARLGARPESARTGQMAAPAAGKARILPGKRRPVPRAGPESAPGRDLGEAEGLDQTILMC